MDLEKQEVLKNFGTDPPTAVEVKAFKMACPYCESTSLSIDDLGIAGRPKDWPPGGLSMAECGTCRRVFLAKLPHKLAMVIFGNMKDNLPAQAIIPVREALGLRK